MSRKPSSKPQRVKIIRYETPDGKRCSKSTPGAIRKAEWSETYYVRRVNPRTGKRERISLETDHLGQAWKKLDKIKAQWEAEALGVIETTSQANTRPILELVDEWLKQLLNSGKTTQDHIRVLKARLHKLVSIAEWTRVIHINRSSTLAALAAVQNERAANTPTGYSGRSARTRNQYLGNLKQFVGWLVADGYLDKNPLLGIKPIPTSTDTRHLRHIPTDEEIVKLMEYLESDTAAVLKGMGGPTRALAYRMAMVTGFRAAEVRSITPVSFDLEKGYVALPGKSTKNRKAVRQPLPEWIVDEVRTHLDKGLPLWSSLPRQHPGRLLKLDLGRAGVAYKRESADGTTYFDFHSLRHWYCTWAANQPGISPKVLLTLARHSDANLTLHKYAKDIEGAAKTIANDIPRPGGNKQ